jgi:membrane-bound lytic murein transglycosylase D
MIKKNLKYLFFLFGGFLLIVLLMSTRKELETEFSDNPIMPLPQIVKAPPIKNYYLFAGERVPTESFDVMERLDRELINNAYGHSNAIQSMKLSARYFPIIAKILNDYNIPEDFKYMAIAESGLRNVISSAGATGYWQLMKPTGIEMGLIINEEIDERYDIEKSTVAAAKYLQKLKSRFGTWHNTISAYNLGMTKYRKNQETQIEEDFYDLNLNSETMRYLFRLVAIKELFENPHDFGYQIDENDKYRELNDYFLVQVDSTITNLGKFAKDNNTSYRMLKIYNPWIINDKLTIQDTSLLIKIKK